MTSLINKIAFLELPQIAGGLIQNCAFDGQIADLITDSRKANPTKESVFFAIQGQKDGHSFISGLYSKGCRQFVVEKYIDVTSFPDCNILQVNSSLEALQKLGIQKRKSFSFPVIGITGSNGKTIVKEWLNQLLSSNYNVVKNPGSYNSQLGVPLSVWQMDNQHNLGIFEAGISKPGEMKKLEEIIQPTIGIFTNVLSAHDEGFESSGQKAFEKAQLFQHASAVIFCSDHESVKAAMDELKSDTRKNFTWGIGPDSDVGITKLDQHTYRIDYRHNSINITKDFSDAASWENLFHCIATMIYLGHSLDEISTAVMPLKSLPMRLEMKAGLSGCTIIDDSYSNDLAGLTIALDFFNSQRSGRGIVFLSDMLETGLREKEWINRINSLLLQHKIDQLVAIGPIFSRNIKRLSVSGVAYATTEECLKNFQLAELSNATVLVKGARAFQLEKIARQLERKIHGTVMEIDLNAIAHNLNVFRSKLKPETKIMAMVKAFAYGSGSNEVASVLQFHKVDYLGVAYADEGKWLRSKGIHLPIMVMNPSSESLSTIMEFNLEPSVFSLSLVQSLIQHVDGKELSIHLKLDTGMHRLGFEESEVGELIEILKANPNLMIKSIYSHLSGSDASGHDDFTERQVLKFDHMSSQVQSAIGYPILRHILNSAGISRLSQHQFDMVRLGIGLYGVDPGNELNARLTPAVALRTTISQIKTLKKGDTVGYGRYGKIENDKTVATLAIGYADGYSRTFSCGIGRVLVKNKLAPVIGNVCMDMTMVDVTGLEVSEGDEVIIFGKDLPVTEVASWIDTIPYEILTSTSDRVKRVFFAESV